MDWQQKIRASLIQLIRQPSNTKQTATKLEVIR